MHLQGVLPDACCMLDAGKLDMLEATDNAAIMQPETF